MTTFTAVLKKFEKKGEKTGWTYIEIPEDISETLKPSNKKSFRVKGMLDAYRFEGAALIPMGGGLFILAINQTMRKGIHKTIGNTLKVSLDVDTKEKMLSKDFISCLEDDPHALSFFNTLLKSHQRYFSNWIESAKTEGTKAKRIVQAVEALSMKLCYNEMMRMHQARNKDMGK